MPFVADGNKLPGPSTVQGGQEFKSYTQRSLLLAMAMKSGFDC